MLEMLIFGGALAGMYLFNKEDKNVEQVDKGLETYNYWMQLDYNGQFTYFTTNEYLKDYITTDYYSTNRELTARHVQDIANKLNREFTNINNRY